MPNVRGRHHAETKLLNGSLEEKC